MAKTFTLKKGYCHVNDEDLVISKSEKPGEVSNPKVNFLLVFLSIMLIITIVYTVRNFNRDSVLTPVYGVAAGIIALNLILNWNKSSDTVIKLADVVKIEHKPAGTLTSDFFIVKYCVKGKMKQRVLMLARAKNNKEVNKAKKILSSIVELS
jgi:hypothetical protein